MIDRTKDFATGLASAAEIQEWFEKTIAGYPMRYPEEREYRDAIRREGVQAIIDSCYAGWSDEEIRREDPEFFRIKETLKHIL